MDLEFGGCGRVGEWVDVNKESKLLFVKYKKVRMVGGLVGGSGGCKPRIEGIVKWGCGFSQGDQSVCVNEGLKGCRSGVGSWWLRTKNLSHCKI